MKNWISPAIPILLCETDQTIKCNEHFSDFNIDVIPTTLDSGSFTPPTATTGKFL